MALLPVVGQVWSILVLLVGQFGVALGLSLTRHLPEMQQYQTAGYFSCFVSWKAFVGGWDLQSDQLSVPILLLGPQSDFRVWLSVPLPWGRSHFGVVLGSVRAACTLLSLWHHSGYSLAKIILEGADPQKCKGGGVPSVSKVWTGLLLEGTYSWGLAGCSVSTEEHGCGMYH